MTKRGGDTLTTLPLKVGTTYRGKKPRKSIMGNYDDRTIIWIGPDMVQYDSIAVGFGRHFPSVSIERFIKWADSEVDYDNSSNPRCGPGS